MVTLRKINTNDRTSKDFDDFKRLKLQVISKIYTDGKNKYNIIDSETEYYTDSDITYNIDNRKAKVLLIEYKNKTVGCIEYYLDKHPYDFDKRAIILNILGVDPDYRGLGIGREAMEQFKRNTKYTVFLDHFFGTANNFYKDLGAVVVQEKFMLK